MIALISVTLPAQRPGRRGVAGRDSAATLSFLLEKYDVNKNGKIEKAEYNRGDETFARLDRNGDGVISKDDFGSEGAGRRGARGGQRGGRMGGAMLGMFFARYVDADQDREVTQKDWDTFLKNCAQSDEAIVTEDGFEEAGANPRVLAFLGRTLDANGDGDLSRGELSKAFEKVDGNKDGKIAGDELGQARRRGQQGRRGRGQSGREGGRGQRGQRSRGGRELPQAGEKAPDFTLPSTDDPKKLVTLSDFAGKRPVALIFGSYT